MLFCCIEVVFVPVDLELVRFESMAEGRDVVGRVQTRPPTSLRRHAGRCRHAPGWIEEWRFFFSRIVFLFFLLFSLVFFFPFSVFL